MKIKITRQTFVQGKLAEPDEVFDNLPDKDVYNLLGANKAVKYSGEDESVPEKNEYLQLAEEMNGKALFKIADELKVNIKNLKREEANKLVAEAMEKADKGN